LSYKEYKSRPVWRARGVYKLFKCCDFLLERILLKIVYLFQGAKNHKLQPLALSIEIFFTSILVLLCLCWYKWSHKACGFKHFVRSSLVNEGVSNQRGVSLFHGRIFQKQGFGLLLQLLSDVAFIHISVTWHLRSLLQLQRKVVIGNTKISQLIIPNIGIFSPFSSIE